MSRKRGAGPSTSFGEEGSGVKRAKGAASFGLGSVTRIELTNFMCHGSVVMETGPSVNMITGRNGAGKSSILQALVIGEMSTIPRDFFCAFSRQRKQSFGRYFELDHIFQPVR